MVLGRVDGQISRYASKVSEHQYVEMSFTGKSFTPDRLHDSGVLLMLSC